MRDLCFKNPRRKPRDPANIHVMGKLSDLMIDQPLLTKYNDPRNPTVTIHIDNQPTTNNLTDLGAAINVMTKEIFISLGIIRLIFSFYKPKPTWGGHPLILGRSWLATADAYIGCRSRSMVISYGQATQNLSLYPPEKPHMDLSSPWWDEFEPESDLSLPHLTFGKEQ